MKRRINLMVCDINIRNKGHYISYCQYIIDNFQSIENNQSHLHISFLLNEEAKKRLDFSLIALSRTIFVTDPNTSTLRSRIAVIKKIKSIAKSQKVDYLVLMDLDQYQIPIFLQKFTFRLSGILFRPHHRILSPKYDVKCLFQTKAVQIKKIMAEKLLLKNPAVDKVFILNDSEGVITLNKKHNTDRFKDLVDPVYEYTAADHTCNNEVKQAYRYLIFGSLDERKNIENILYAYCSCKFERQTEILLVGKMADEYLERIKNIISGFSQLDMLKKSISIHNAFVSNTEMEEFFAKSDVCLLIYKDFYGSSGVLGRATCHNKKVIGANVGLMRTIIDEFRLGLVCDPLDIKAISTALNAIQTFKLDPASCKAFRDKSTPEVFLNNLLSQ